MTATIKVDTIKEVNSSVANIVLDSSGNVTIGNNLTVTGATTQTGSTTFTTQTLFPDGSVSAPAISNTGDTNCGIYFPAADNVAIATGGVAALTADSSQNVTVGPSYYTNDTGETGGTNLSMGASFKRNRFINGNMLIDQRYSGAAFGTSINGYTVDRWQVYQSVTGKINGGQNYNSVTPPTGFSNYIGIQSQSAYTLLSGDYYGLRQLIEGYNVADLAWGTANAKAVTLSFWARSSLTGNFGCVIQNPGFVSYPVLYNISEANKWKYITVNVPGPTIGTWGTTTAIGLGVVFSLGSGTTYQGAPNVWVLADYNGTIGQNQLVSNNGATLYITGVQLEVGSVATPYERQIYSDQLAQCQRYYLRNKVEQNSTSTFMIGVTVSATTAPRCTMAFPVAMRATPTASFSACRLYDASNVSNVTSFSAQYSSTTIGCVDVIASGGGLTGQRPAQLIEGSGAAYVEFSAEF